MALSPHKAAQILVVGKKGTGKTELAYRLFDTYPEDRDRVLVDPNGDIKLDKDARVETLHGPPPAIWPQGPQLGQLVGAKKRGLTLRFVPDFGSPRYLEDIDRAAALAYNRGNCLLFVDEAHEAVPAGRVPPTLRRVLRQARHRQLSTIFATPRPMTIDPLTLSNADQVYIFSLPNPDDRKRIAESIGWDPKDFSDAVHALAPHEYLRYDSTTAGPDGHPGDLAHFPPLPEDLIRHHRK